MAMGLDEYVKKLPAARQAAIKKRSAELMEEEASLQALRQVHKKSQTSIARKLKIKQAAVSKLERRADMYVSTLRKYIEAMGGSLDIVARFPKSAPVKITQFEGFA